MFRVMSLLLVFLSACATQRPAHVIKARVGLPADAPVPQRVRMHVIDVGQGSATLLEFPCAAVLVDAGGESSATFDSNKALEAYLDDFFDRREDLERTFAAVFITHPHLDHTRGLPMVMQRYLVKQLITNGRPRGTEGLLLESGGEQQENAEKEAAARGALRTVTHGEIQGRALTDAQIDPVACGEVDPVIEVLWGSLEKNFEGWEPRVFQNANNHSLVIKVDVGGHAILITGDLEHEAIASLLAAEGHLLNSDVVLVGHHGSHNGTSTALMASVTPCTGVVSMGPASREEDWTAWAYGHPRKKAIDMVHDALGCGRAPKEVLVGLGQRRFEPFLVKRALYGTGWEGTVIVEQTARGTWRTLTER